MSNASAVYCSGTYQEMRTVFTCMGRCNRRPYGVHCHCSDCELLLLLLSRVAVGEYRGDRMIPNLVRHNAIANRWQDELDKEIRVSTSELPHLLDNAIQARGMGVIWQRLPISTPAVLTIPPFHDDTDETSLKELHASAMAMCINTRAVPGPGAFRSRLHVVPHNAGLMLRDLIMLPSDAAAAHVVNVIDRHTLPLETAP